jgi:hypothetical protein
LTVVDGLAASAGFAGAKNVIAEERDHPGGSTSGAIYSSGDSAPSVFVLPNTFAAASNHLMGNVSLQDPSTIYELLVFVARLNDRLPVPLTPALKSVVQAPYISSQLSLILFNLGGRMF